MEILQKKHRQEQKDLQSRITQKKKSATKKTRKGILDECDALERELKEKQALELPEIHVACVPPLKGLSPIMSSAEDISVEPLNGVEDSMNSLALSSMAVPESTKKPNRQKARLARRAAKQEATAAQASKDAANLPNLRDQERGAMLEEFTVRNLKEKDIRPDGHCLYAAIADQLADAKIDWEPREGIDGNSKDIQLANPGYRIIRQVTASYISHHPDDFLPFMEQPLQQYVQTIRDTAEWGGHLELMALAQAYGVTINVLQGDGKVEKIGCGEDSSDKQLWLAYYRHSFGLGEHYNSLRRAI